ncbi:NmrA family NAD(P)-binding protein [Ulvibacterium sp.]|uniref:NmrA family NAD(P)-binding protein n=1 Tax=Ulvibacterium sp. TaxID=2665914 RepID=UPI0026307C42|nr:NmrA family NAD(P)-binding protein [Ulvibacterium sp.]
MDKIFVTGATGNIGKYLVKYLRELKVPFTAGSSSITKQEYPTSRIDYEDEESLRLAFKEHNILFLLTPDSENSMNWVHNAIEAAKEAGIKHIVRSSGIGADAESDYFVFKELGEIENIVKNSGLNYTIIQPNSFFQNFATFQNQTVKNGAVFLPHDNAKVSYVDVRDVALAIATVLKEADKHKSKTYVITGGTAISDQELLDEIGKVLNKRISYISVSDQDTIDTFRKYHMPEHNIKQLISLYQADRTGLTGLVSPDFTKLTGKESRTSHVFAKDYRSYWK